LPLFVTCVATGGSPSVAPCADVGGVAHAPVVLEMAAPGSVSFENANTLFAYGFSNVLILWLVAVSVGMILSLIRKG